METSHPGVEPQADRPAVAPRVRQCALDRYHPRDGAQVARRSWRTPGDRQPKPAGVVGDDDHCRGNGAASKALEPMPQRHALPDKDGGALSRSRRGVPAWRSPRYGGGKASARLRDNPPAAADRRAQAGDRDAAMVVPRRQLRPSARLEERAEDALSRPRRARPARGAAAHATTTGSFPTSMGPGMPKLAGRDGPASAPRRG